MKTMIKICGKLAALTAVLLVTAVLVTSCVEPISGFQPPEGMGSVRLIIGNTGRSITPSTANPGFTRFKLSFQPSSGTAIEQDVLVANIGTAINLLPGNYVVTVIGQTGTGVESDPPASTDDPYVDAAVGVSASFTITSGVMNTSVTVPIKPYAYGDGTGNGTFTYTLSLGGLTAVTTGVPATQTPRLIIKSLLGNAYADSDVQAGTVTKQTVSLPSGFYSVEYVLTTANGTARSYDILHIYQGLTSDFPYSFSSGQFVTGGGSIVNPDFGLTDTKPTLTKTVAPTAITDSTIITLSIGATPPANKEVVTITNPELYDSVVWRVAGVVIDDGDGELDDDEFTITAGADSFVDVKDYEVIVIGTISTGANAGVYGTKFVVRINN